MNVDNFDMQAKRESQRVVTEATEAIRSASLQLAQDLITDAKTLQGPGGSPVASGRFAASMRVEINGIDYSSAPPDPNYRYPSGSGPRPLPPRTIPNRPIAQYAAKLRRFKLGDRIYFSNSVPYVRRIELGSHSWQTPEGAFVPTIRAWLTKFRNLQLRVRRV